MFLFSLHTKTKQTKHGNHANRKSYKPISVFVLVKPSSFVELLGFHIPLILINEQEFKTFGLVNIAKVVNTITVVEYFNNTEHYLTHYWKFFLTDSKF